MKVEKQFVWKSIYLLVFTYIILLFYTCMSVDEDFISPKLIVPDEGSVQFESDGGSKTFEIESNRDWSVKIESNSDWINVNPMSGSKEITELTINVDQNESDIRTGSVKISASTINKIITVTQKGKDSSSYEYITIKDIRDMYVDSEKVEMIIDDPLMLKAVVISDREGANRFAKKDGYIQDDAGVGIAFRVTQSETLFDMGDELMINLKDAKIHYDYAKVLQIVFSTKNVEVVSQNVIVSPREITIEEVKMGMHDATLVRFKNVQFEVYKGFNYYSDEGSATSRSLVDSYGNSIGVNTTKNASFSNKALPAGSGNIVGIVSCRNENWELQMRNIDDAREISNDKLTRFEQKELPIAETKITVANLRTRLEDGEIYTGNNYIEGEVVLNAFKGNLPINLVFIADETAGIALSFYDRENILTSLPFGSKLKVRIKDSKAKNHNGLLQLGYNNTLATKSVEIVERKSSNPLQPKMATIDDILAGRYQSELVEIGNVQFNEIEVSYGDCPFIIDKSGNELQVFTKENADFAEENVKDAMGTIVAIASASNYPHLLIRSIDDLSAMKGARFDASPFFIITNKNKVNFQSRGGEERVTISSNVNWIASSNASWLSITPISGVNDGEIIVTANKNDGEERKAIISITDGITETIEVIQSGIVQSSGMCNDLFFSEYIEGSSYNKYLEIYNGTGATVDLSDYIIELYSNGGTKSSSMFFLEGFLKTGKVLVLKNSRADIYKGAATPSGVVNFNGNDAVVLLKLSENGFDYVDIIGCIGEDPGEKKGWFVFENEDLTTKDRTLVRKPFVRGGVVVNPAKGFPTLATEWIGYPIDTAEHLGSHTMD